MPGNMGYLYIFFVLFELFFVLGWMVDWMVFGLIESADE